MLHHIGKGENNSTESHWRFHKKFGHERPLIPSEPSYSRSRWNVHMEWENGESTIEPLAVIAPEEPVTCDIHAQQSNLGMGEWGVNHRTPCGHCTQSTSDL